MSRREFGEAIDHALAEAMARDERIVVWGEDVPMLRPGLLARFGAGRIRGAPISEAAFLGAAVGASLGGLRPVVEIMLVDFIAVALDALLNHAAKVEAFTGGRWHCPMVVRATCGGGYGDGGQHEQNLWGLLAGVPGLAVVVPSNPSDAAGLMHAALAHDGPVVYLEHKLLSRMWLDFMGGGGRATVTFDVPAEGRAGRVDPGPGSVQLGEAVVRRRGTDVSLVSLAVGVHRCLDAASALEADGISCEVVDLRSVRPLDVVTVAESVERTGCMVVVDEDYREFGLSGELAAALLERGLTFAYRRVCLDDTLPYARHLEEKAIPNISRICEAARSVGKNRSSERNIS